MNKPPLPVTFRKATFEAGSELDSEIVAVFPDSYPGTDLRGCYAHIGQHGECDVGWLYDLTTEATPSEYDDLLKELRGIYEHGEDAVTLIVTQLDAPTLPLTHN